MGAPANVSVRWRIPPFTVAQLLIIGFIVAIVTLLVVGGSATLRIRALILSQAEATRAAEALTSIDSTLGAVKDAETGQRGYLITGNQAYLAPYNESLQAIQADVSALDRMFSDNPDQEALLRQLMVPLSSKLQELAQTIELRRRDGFSAARAVVLSNRGAQDMTRIRSLLNQMLQVQSKLLQRRLSVSADSGANTQRTILWGSLIGALVVGVAAMRVTGTILGTVRRITSTANRISAGDFSASAPLEGPGELASMASAVNAALDAVTHANDALLTSENRVLRLNDDLENRVRERTAELVASNRELDSFTYSVAHDLRSPLRSLHGYSQLIQDGYANTFDPVALNYFQRIQVNTVQMERLIDDLLRLSQAGRIDLSAVPVDLSRIANEILQELRLNEPGRMVQTHVLADLTTLGDEGLVRLMLYQMLANSWKFTSMSDPARIEVGEDLLEAERTFFVGDNGVGFDQRYAGKLFTPFQRLHGPSEFSGNGIGLAIAERVASRHGGRIWAESVPDQGATFFFTLTKPKRGERLSGTDGA